MTIRPNIARKNLDDDALLPVSPSEEINDDTVSLSKDDRNAIEAFRSKHTTAMLVILFTDLVNSTAFKSEKGDAIAKDLGDEHKRLLDLALGERKDAQIIKQEGDSFLAVFLKPSDAVQFALRALQLHRKARAKNFPELPKFRTGIHLGTVILEEGLKGPGAPGEIGDIQGLQVDTTARIMSLAQGDQILCSRAVHDDARQAMKNVHIEGIGALDWRSHGSYTMRGREEPLEVCEMGEKKETPFTKPPRRQKSETR